MKPYYSDERATVLHADCLDALASLPADSVDAIVTDPPYDLTANKRGGSGAASVNLNSPYGRARIGTGNGSGGFMGKAWDATGVAFDADTWRAAMRVLKPGGHLLAFGGTRTWHRLAVAVEDAGFEMRDSIAWLYGSGFPKSLDVSKAIDKAAGAEREVVGTRPVAVDQWTAAGREAYARGESTSAVDITAPATPAAQQWDGWGTAMKPAHEPVVCARKPLDASAFLARIGSQLDALEDSCRPNVDGAARSSAPTRADSSAARTATAPESAATRHEAGQEPTTATGAAAGSSDATATSVSEWTGETFWNTVTSWRKCWAELCEATSTSTTSTATSRTTDLQTLSSCLSKITQSVTATSTPEPDSLRSLVTAADNLFAAGVLNSRSTLALSAIESATNATPPDSQDAGGSSPAFEPIVVARKPLAGTVAQNVLTHGTGALNIDGCRIAGDGGGTTCSNRDESGRCNGHRNAGRSTSGETFHGANTSPAGRWPANVVLDESQAAALDEQSGVQRDGVAVNRNRAEGERASWYGTRQSQRGEDVTYGGEGGASRFFFVCKGDKMDACGNASTAEPSSSQQSARGDSAPSDAATSASLADNSSSRSTEPSMSATATESRPRSASDTQAILSTAPRCSPESRQPRHTPTSSPARNAEPSEPTGTTTTTQSRSKSAGSAAPATFSTTPKQAERGVRALPLDALNSRFTYTAKAASAERPKAGKVAHPTVKPLDLMRWLVRLVTPPGGLVLDPFAGSGTTLEAAIVEGFRCIGIEREADYLQLIDQRIARACPPLDFTEVPA